MESEQPPQIVYKYRNWHDEYHKDVLLKNHLFLASPENFNDPFDCRIPINYKLLNTNDKIKQYVNEYLDRHHDTLTKDGVNFDDHAAFISDKLTNHIDEVQYDNESRLYKDQNERYGVLSLSKRWDSILMWSHYSDFHKGYCVGFWTDKLNKSRLFGKGGPVIYNPNDDYPEITPLNSQNSMENLLSKPIIKQRIGATKRNID